MDQPNPTENLIGNVDKQGLIKLLFKHEGRVGRKEYWLFSLLAFLTFLVIGIIAGILGDIGSVLLILAYIPGVYASVIIQIKRLHDLNQVGWLVLLNLVPFIGGIGMLIWLGFFPGTEGPNKFGLPRSGGQIGA